MLSRRAALKQLAVAGATVPLLGTPAEAVRRCRTRLFDVHIKDSMAEVGKADIPIEMGRGKLDLRNILTALIETGYRENVWLEYEKDPNDPVPGLAESVGYVRGLLRGLSPA